MATPNRTSTANNSFISPNRITRLQEKEDLCNLNDRLVVYIDKVRSLESENNGLRLRITEHESEVTREVSGLKAAYETELDDARLTLDSVAKEKARLELDLGELKEEFRDLKARNTKNEADLESAQQRLKELEALLNSKEASLATAQGEKRSVEVENRGLKGQVAKLERSLEETRKQLHDEKLRRVDGENRIQTLKEQLEFQRNIHSEELRDMQHRYKSRIEEVESTQQQDYECKLSEALTEMRRQQDQQIQQYKDEIEKTYSAKLENARQSAERNNRLLENTQEELQLTMARLESVTAQLNQLQKQLVTRDSQIRDLEDRLFRERDNARRQHREKDQDMSVMQAELQKKLDDYQDLMDIKLSLDREILAYKKLLEGEEERLHLSPSTPHTVIRGSGRRTPAKRRLYDTDIEPSFSSRAPGFRIIQQAQGSSLLTVHEVDIGGKYVVVRNKGDKDQNLGDWQLKHQVGDEPIITFKFPAQFILGARQQVKIWGSESDVAPNPPSDLVWNDQPTWGTGDMLLTTLINADEEEMAMRKVTRILFQDDENGTSGSSPDISPII